MERISWAAVLELGILPSLPFLVVPVQQKPRKRKRKKIQCARLLPARDVDISNVRNISRLPTPTSGFPGMMSEQGFETFLGDGKNYRR